MSYTRTEEQARAHGGFSGNRFKGVWREILHWFQQYPDTTAPDLPDRLMRRYPGRYSRRQLRTLQHRVKQ